MAQGPSSSATPYLVGIPKGVAFTSIITSGDSAPGAAAPGDVDQVWQFVGIPDGLGFIDNGDGTGTVLVNHEIGNAAGVVRDHGSLGSFVSELTIDLTTLAVTEGDDLGQVVYLDPDGDGVYVQGTTAFARLCSGDLPDQSAFYYVPDDLSGPVGTQARIYLNGEETGPEGRAFAWVVDGDEAGTVWELPALGNFSWENSVANPTASLNTVVVGLDDATPGQVYVYVGQKQADNGTNTAIEQAGLVGGALYGIVAAGIGPNTVGAEPVLNGSFSLALVPNAATITGVQTETASDAAGISEFFRPEDGAWDTVDPNRFYFVTTANFDSPSRLWAFDFVDGTDPTLGGTFTALLDGTEGQRMFDNITVTADGRVVLQEDPGNQPYLAQISVYDPATDRLYDVAQHDPARFSDPGTATVPNAAGFTQDEESSGVIDVTDTFGDADTYAFLLDVQAHVPFAAPGAQQTEIVEKGQLLLMTVELSIFDNADSTVVQGTTGDDSLQGRKGNDSIFGDAGNDRLRGDGDNDRLFGEDGDDTLNGGDGTDILVGGLGADVIKGGVGYDLIRYNSAAEGGDRVIWETNDQLQFSASGFGGGLVAGMNVGAEGRFQQVEVDGEVPMGTTPDGTGTFIFDINSRNLFYDADGSGADVADFIGVFRGVSVVAADIEIIA